MPQVSIAGRDIGTRSTRNDSHFRKPAQLFKNTDKMTNDIGVVDYNDSNRAFLQAFMAHSSMTFEEARPILAAIFSAHGTHLPTTQDLIRQLLTRQNANLSPPPTSPKKTSPPTSQPPTLPSPPSTSKSEAPCGRSRQTAMTQTYTRNESTPS